MKTNRIPAIVVKVALIMALAGAANACVLIPVGGGKGGGGGGGGEVTICHKGKKTMTLPADAVAAHMDHGDHRGPC